MHMSLTIIKYNNNNHDIIFMHTLHFLESGAVFACGLKNAIYAMRKIK